MRPSAFRNVSFTFLMLVTFFFSEIVFSRGAHLAGELGHVLQPYAFSGNGCPSSSGMGKDAGDHHGHGDDSANNHGDGCCTPAHSHASMCGSTVNLPEAPGLALQEMVEHTSFLPEVFLSPPTPPPNIV